MQSFLVSFLATALSEGEHPAFHWRPFLGPAPLWNDTTWPWLLVPLCIGVVIVYKCVKCKHMGQVPWQAFRLSTLVLFGMGMAALVLMLIVHGLERANP